MDARHARDIGEFVRREGVEYVEAPAYQRRRRRRSVGDHRKANAIDQRPLAAADPVGRAGQLPVSLETRQVDLLLSSEEHTSELPSLMRIPYAVFCLKKKNN